MMMREDELVVDGVGYPLASLNEAAQAQLTNLQFVEAEIARLKSQLAVMETARNAYAQALREALPRALQ